MRAEPYFLINKDIKKSVINRIMDLECDGEIKVIISSAGTKTDRQRNLDWKWNSEIFKSGIGWHDKTVEETHARSKWMFAKNIWLRDDDVFPIIYEHFMSKFGSDKEKCLKFAMDYMHTEKFSKYQACEYMKNKESYWIDKGVNLTDPKTYGLEFYYCS